MEYKVLHNAWGTGFLGPWIWDVRLYVIDTMRKHFLIISVSSVRNNIYTYVYYQSRTNVCVVFQCIRFYISHVIFLGSGTMETEHVPLPFTCITCRVSFSDAEMQRSHYKTDWHRYNLKRKVAQMPPVTAEVFFERVMSQRAQVVYSFHYYLSINFHGLFYCWRVRMWNFILGWK